MARLRGLGANRTKRRYQGIWYSVGIEVGSGYPIDYFPQYGDTGIIPDTTNPVVTITSPAVGASVTGGVTITGTVTDDISVSSVIVRVNGVTLGLATISGSNWTYQWTTTAGDIGSRGITAQASDSSGNTATSSVRTVTVVAQSSTAPLGQAPLGVAPLGGSA